MTKAWNDIKNMVNENFPTMKSIVKSCRALKKTNSQIS